MENFWCIAIKFNRSLISPIDSSFHYQVHFVTWPQLYCATNVFQILLWLRKQMSREKDTEDGDRQGLVEDGTICQPDKLAKDAKESVEAKWVHKTDAKPPASTHVTRSIPTASSLPEVNGNVTRVLILPRSLQAIKLLYICSNPNILAHLASNLYTTNTMSFKI